MQLFHGDPEYVDPAEHVPSIELIDFLSH